MPFCGQYSAKNPPYLYNGDWQTDENGENGAWQSGVNSATPVVSHRSIADLTVSELRYKYC